MILLVDGRRYVIYKRFQQRRTTDMKGLASLFKYPPHSF